VLGNSGDFDPAGLPSATRSTKILDSDWPRRGKRKSRRNPGEDGAKRLNDWNVLNGPQHQIAKRPNGSNGIGSLFRNGSALGFREGN